MNRTATKGFFKLCLTTLVAVYFLIAVGGIVRATGSGMGCPDWPKCFGSWVPPTSVEQLPENYKDSYAQYRDKKNQKFVRLLHSIGMHQTADQISNDKTILIEADFNPVKTWIEYLNRIVGVIIGLLIVLLFARSINYRKSHPSIFWLALATLVAVLFQGWFGSIVVSTNLTQWTITVHMFLAMVIVAILVYLLWISREQPLQIEATGSVKWWLIICAVLLLIQTFFGTQVREAIDRLAGASRETWIGSLGGEFIIHRSFSWVIVLAHGYLLWKLYKTSSAKALTTTLMVLILASVFSGVGMAYGGVPPFLQPIHLTLATVTFGLQLYLFFGLNSRNKTVLVN